MSATDELRRLLDERGARWTACSKAVMDNQTYCYGHTYTEFQDGLMVTNLTPEQAVEATLGRGTCRMETEESCQNWMSCSECHADYYNDQPINYCPNCGAKVV